MKLRHTTLRSTRTVSSVGAFDIDADGCVEATPEQAAHLIKCGFLPVAGTILPSPEAPAAPVAAPEAPPAPKAEEPILNALVEVQDAPVAPPAPYVPPKRSRRK